MGSRIAAIAFLAISSLPSIAHAAPTKDERERAHQLMDQGKDKTKAGDLKGALDAYKKAHDIMHVPTTGIALARTHAALGHLVEAREVAVQVERMPKEANEPAPFDKAREQAKELETQISPRIPTLQIRGATKAVIDDVDVGRVDSVPVNPGKHSVFLKGENGEKRLEVEIGEKETKEVAIEAPVIKKPDPAPPPPTQKPTHEERTPLATGLMYGGYGLAGAGLLTAGITGLLALGKSGDVKDQCENGICDPSVRSDLDGARSLATVSTIGFVVLGVGLAAGTVGLLLPKTRREESVWLGPHGIEGRF